ncbi:MAG: hypothetical protein AB1384_12135 [Actinomycetota bacterium]
MFCITVPGAVVETISAVKVRVVPPPLGTVPRLQVMVLVPEL